MPADPGGGPTSELERLRLENETLSAVVSVVTSGPDLRHILDRVVDLLTGATSSHACFVYLRVGDRLVLRAASPVYAHLAGRISFGADEGLAGWTMRNGEPAFIREGAIDDPRTIYVPELEEERFQSMVAVPIPSRAGESIGAIVLHTVAPREFDEGIINVLARAASLVAGAIENASLYEEARDRVEALTRLAQLGREMSGESDRASLHRVVVAGVRGLLGADTCRLYELDEGDGPLRRVGADPATEASEAEGETEAVLDLLESEGPPDEALAARLATALELPARPAEASAVSLVAAGNRIGVLLAASLGPWAEVGADLLRAAAQQVALAMEKTALIERLTEENLGRDLFDALGGDQPEAATEKAAAAGLDLRRSHAVLAARPRSEDEEEPWPARAKGLERAIKGALPGTFCHLTPDSLLALTPVVREGTEAAREVKERLGAAVADPSLAIGVSTARRGAAEVGLGLREAEDAAAIATLVEDQGDVVLYRDTGAYRYLIDFLDSGGPPDHLRAAVERVAVYDRERRSQLLLTLDSYLAQGRSVAATARVLFIHANTLRQRLERIETLAGFSLAEEDLLALHLAVKLALVRVATPSRESER